MEENTKVPVGKASLIYGIIVGLVSIVFSLILYFIGQTLETWAMIASTIISIGMIVLVLILFKREYGKGYAKFGQLVLVSFLVGLFSAILTSVYTFSIYTADEGYLQDTKYYAIERMDKQMEKMDARYQERMSDDQYDAFEERMEQQREKQVKKVMERSPLSFALSGIIGSIFMAVIVGLIAGIFIKKDPEPIVE